VLGHSDVCGVKARLGCLCFFISFKIIFVFFVFILLPSILDYWRDLTLILLLSTWCPLQDHPWCINGITTHIKSVRYRSMMSRVSFCVVTILSQTWRILASEWLFGFPVLLRGLNIIIAIVWVLNAIPFKLWYNLAALYWKAIGYSWAWTRLLR
jgi:hypothetical protein